MFGETIYSRPSQTSQTGLVWDGLWRGGGVCSKGHRRHVSQTTSHSQTLISPSAVLPIAASPSLVTISAPPHCTASPADHSIATTLIRARSHLSFSPFSSLFSPLTPLPSPAVRLTGTMTTRRATAAANAAKEENAREHAVREIKAAVTGWWHHLSCDGLPCISLRICMLCICLFFRGRVCGHARHAVERCRAAVATVC